jgi:ParB family transcriptional regulator, chromosome partitioning protein
MSQFYNDSIFWVEVEKVRPNPYQPRREFDEAALKALSDSIKQYGVLQALVVTKVEVPKEDGGFGVEYELIAGERRLRASKLAGLKQVPVLIRAGEETDLMKLELAIIENVQREDLNPVERAKAFKKLVDEFGFKHATIGQKIGKSREYVSNTLRILALPEEMVNALSEGKITEGHTRPLLMLTDRPEEQMTLFKEIIYKKINVREAEMIARKIAIERARKITPEMDPLAFELEEKFSESLGTRVQIEKKRGGGKLVIDFFSYDDLNNILNMLKHEKRNPNEMLEKKIAEVAASQMNETQTTEATQPEEQAIAAEMPEPEKPEDDRTPEEIKVQENTDLDDELYSLKNFSL